MVSKVTLERYASTEARSKGQAQLSIVVSSYTSERLENLLDLLDSVEGQTVPAELVAVVEKDEALRDKVLERLRGSRMKWTIVFSKSRLGISNARNLGVENSTASFVGFVDDDAILFPDWTKMAIEAFGQYPEIIGVTGEVLPKWSDPSSVWFPKSLYWIIGCTGWRNSLGEELGQSVSGVNMIFRKEAFVGVAFLDGFADGAQREGKLGFPNEDNDFALRLTLETRQRILFTPRVRVYHAVYPFKLTNRYIRRYSFWQGVAESRYNDMFGNTTRRSSRKRFILGAIHDLTKPDVSNLPKRVQTLLNFVLFGYLGFLAYRYEPFLRFVNRHL
jgi:glycosyltransferase involved in cell wall biosynthesis